jgi:hypothetical protein
MTKHFLHPWVFLHTISETFLGNPSKRIEYLKSNFILWFHHLCKYVITLWYVQLTHSLVWISSCWGVWLPVISS